MNEIWKDIEGFDGLYQISSKGSARSVDRFVSHFKGGLRLMKGRALRYGMGTNGYPLVVLSKEGKTHTKYLHRLVAEAFLPNTLTLREVNHINRNKLDASLSNLEWVTPSGNQKHWRVTSKQF
jgi:hypothetical protein